MRPRRHRRAITQRERELALIERRLMAELRRELDRRLLEQRRYVQGEVDGVHDRIDGVLTRALRALNTRQGGTPA